MISPLRYVISLTKRSKLTIFTIAIVVMFVTSTLAVVYSFEMSNKALIERFESRYYVISSDENLLKSRVEMKVENAAYIWITPGKVNNQTTYVIGVYDPHNILGTYLSCDEDRIIVGRDVNTGKHVHLQFLDLNLNLTLDRKMSFSYFPDYWVIVNNSYFAGQKPNFMIVDRNIQVEGYMTKSLTSLTTFYERTAEEISFDLFLLDLISMVVIYLFINALLTIEIRENVKKIAIMRAIGSTRKNIAALYLLRSLYIGTAGSVIGFSLGVSLAYLLAALIPLSGMLTYFYIYVPPIVFIADVIIAIIGSLIAAISPIYSAVKINIVKGMKGVVK